MENKLKKIIALLFFLYLSLLPLMCLPRPFPLGNKIQYADIVFAILFLLWAFYALTFRKTRLPDAKIIIALGLLIMVNLFSCAFSKKIITSMPDFMGLIYLSLLFITASSILCEKKVFENSIRLILIVSAAVSMFGLASFAAFTMYKCPWAMKFLVYLPYKASIIPFPRISSTLVTPEMFIIFSHLGLVSGMAFLEINKDRKWTATIILCIGIILITATIAFSRSLTGLFFTFSAMLFLKKTTRYLLPFKIITAAFAVFLFLSAVIASIWTIFPVTVSRDTTAELLTVNINTSDDIRAILRTAAVNIALKYPLFGVGQGIFTDEAENYVDLSAAKNTLRTNNYDTLRLDPHSAYFGALAETGLLGLAAICFFLALLLRAAWILINKSRASTWKTISAYFFWGLIGYLITGFYVDILSIRSFWLLGALLLSASNIAEAHEKY